MRRTLRGQAADDAVADFNATPVDPGSSSSCPPVTKYFTARFHSAGTSWVATFGCPGIDVTRSGHELPYLTYGDAFRHDIIHGFRTTDG
jgi:hypothetical protein